MSGKLFVCGTPIGNLEDVTLRVLRVLKECDLIAAEDTRNTVKLLNYFEIKTPLTSYHKFNEEEKGAKLVEKILSGDNVALVSDAGMPGISDPGAVLINMCRKAGAEVCIVPGPTAVVSALVLSGMECRSFVFEGFLPANKHMRRTVLERLKTEKRTTVFYEAPHHLRETLKEIFKACGDREAAAVREITKKHEETVRTDLGKLINYFEENEPRGEFVLIIGGAKEEEAAESELSMAERVLQLVNEGIDKKEAMKICAKERGVSKKTVYAEVLKSEKATDLYIS